MNLVAAHFPQSWLVGAWLIAGALLVRSAVRVPWFKLPQADMTCWFGGTVAVLVAWQMKASLQPGLAFHLIGAVALTLIAGPDRARLGLAVALAADIYDGHGNWASMGLSWLIVGAMPSTLAWQVLRFAQKKMPLNYFTYIFVNSFAAGAVSMWLVGLLTCGLLAAAGAYDFGFLVDEQLPYYFLMGWPEGFTTGIVMTLLVVYFPQWVATFDDGLYLKDK